MKKIKTGNVLMCEYIAQGAYSKHTLVNTYSGDISVQSFPAPFPLAFYIEIFPQDGAPSEMKFQIKQGKKLVGELLVKFDNEVGKPLVVTTPPLMLTFDGPERIQVIVAGEGMKPIVLASKQVNVGHIPGLT